MSSTDTTISFTTPSRSDLTEPGQALYDGIHKGFGKVPNLYAFMAHSANGLGSYLAFQQAQSKGTFSAKEREAVFLVVSQVNGCEYCLAAHTTLALSQGYTDAEIVELRHGRSVNERTAAIVVLAQEIARTGGRPGTDAIENFFGEGFTEAAIIDLVLLVADKTVSNYLHNITGIAIDWPAAPPIA